MTSPDLLTADERCYRLGFWTRDFERVKIDTTELLTEGIREGLTCSRSDFNEAAGEKVIEISAQREIVSDQHSVYDQCIHQASLADIVSYALRKQGEAPWGVPQDITLPGGTLWHSDALLAPSGNSLRRIVLVSAWNDDRHFHEARSWYSLGETCAYNLPLQQAIIILGPSRQGKRHGHWSRAMRHPANKRIRFRKKHDAGTGFKSSWIPLWRENDDSISTHDWLQAMHEDGVLSEVAFTVDLPAPTKDVREKILALAERKLDRIWRTRELPDQQLSTCDWPSACIHRGHCHGGESPNKRNGFVQITA